MKKSKKKFITLVVDADETYEQFRNDIINDPDFIAHPDCYYEESEHGVRIHLASSVVVRAEDD